MSKLSQSKHLWCSPIKNDQPKALQPVITSLKKSCGAFMVEIHTNRQKAAKQPVQIIISSLTFPCL